MVKVFRIALPFVVLWAFYSGLQLVHHTPSVGLSTHLCDAIPMEFVPPHSVFVASLLRNNALILPTFSVALLELSTFLQRRGVVSVSLYESGSTDETSVLVLDLAAALLSDGVRTFAVVNGSTRGSGEHRISFLARLRNLALKPILDGRVTGVDAVLFVNDVVFCAAGAAQLLRQVLVHGDDMACGADFFFPKDSMPNFYDTWATRDVGGRRFRNLPPYVGHAASREAWTSRRPFQVASCWGGMAAFRTDVFMTAGLRFRRSFPGECAASECELFCRDLVSSGRHRIVLVPTAVSAYTLSDWRRVATQTRTYRADHARVLHYVPLPPPLTDCCPLEDDAEDEVDFEHCVPDPVSWFYAAFGTPMAGSNVESEAVMHREVVLTIERVRSALGGVAACKLPLQRIPHRIIQFSTSADPAHIRQHLWFGMISWLRAHPCYEYELVDAVQLQRVVSSSPWFATWAGLGARQRHAFGVYLYMFERGGIYAGTHTLCEHAVSNVIQPSAGFVVGLDAPPPGTTFPAVFEHCWATEPGSHVLRAIIEKVAALLLDPTVPLGLLFDRRLAASGSLVALQEMVTTGVHPFSQVVLDDSTPNVTVLPMHSFRGRLSPVRHYDYGDSKRVAEHRPGIDSLPGNGLMRKGDWFYTERRSTSPSFVLLSSQLLNFSAQRACLTVQTGLWPTDPARHVVWSACGVAAKFETIFVILHSNTSTLTMFAAKNGLCTHVAPPTPRVLWQSRLSFRGSDALVLRGNRLRVRYGNLLSFTSHRSADVSLCVGAWASRSCKALLHAKEKLALRVMFCDGKRDQTGAGTLGFYGVSETSPPGGGTMAARRMWV